MLIVFSGGSGVGKNTVIAELLKSGEYVLMPTYTTRSKREGESEGNPYHFLTDEQFSQKVAEGDFYEYQQVHNHYYGTSKTLLKNALTTGKTLLKDIDVIGTQNLLKAIDDVKLLTFFLKVDSPEILRERLQGRGEKDIELRLQRYDLEQQYAVDYDYVVNNETLQKTLGILNAVIAFERKALSLRGTVQSEISEQKVHAYAEKLSRGEKLSPVKVAVRDGGLVLIKGHHRYLASLATGCRIAKEIVTDDGAPQTDDAVWERLLAAYKQK